MTITRNMHEFFTLCLGLDERHIPYTLTAFFGGMQVRCDNWDAICHEGSYGGDEGLLEVMGVLSRSDYDDVEGYLTAEELLSRLDEMGV